MSKKVISTTKSLYEIISTNIPNKIPYNQRSYTWSKGNWETMWNSFFSIEDQDTFLGSFIFLEPEIIGEPKQIFDGQQRITTLTILSKAIIDVLVENDDVINAGAILRQFIIGFDDKPKLIVSKTIANYFTLNFQNSDIHKEPENGNTKIEKEIYKAYLYFYTQVEDYLNTNNNTDEFYKLYKQRLSELEVVEMTISDIVLGIEIFESVNHRGEQLNASELVKNILIKHARLNDKDLEDLDDRWNKINNRLSLTGFSFIEFMHYYWIAKFKPVGKKHLFTSMKKEFKSDSDKWLEFFHDLELSSKTFENIFNCKDYNSFKVHYPSANSNPRHSAVYMRYLNCFRFIRNKSWIIPIFTLLDYETKLNERQVSIINKDNYLVKIFRKHFVFSFLHFNIFSFPTRDFTPAMYKLSKAINKSLIDFPQDHEKSNKDVKKAFKNHFDGYVKKTIDVYKVLNEEYYEGINKIKHDNNNKHLIHTIFGDIEELVLNGSFHNQQNHSIEHYMPQEAQDNWDISKDISRAHENKLGNILIIDASLNGEMQNKSHVEKLKLLNNAESKTLITKEFIETNEKTDGDYNFEKLNEENLTTSDFISSPSEIDKRTKILADYIKKAYITDFKY